METTNAHTSVAGFYWKAVNWKTLKSDKRLTLKRIIGRQFLRMGDR